MTAIPLTALEQQREDQALGAAWRRCEAAAAAAGCWLMDVSCPEPGELEAFGGYHVRTRPLGPAVLQHGLVGEIFDSGPTPTAALNALADRLEAGNG